MCEYKQTYIYIHTYIYTHIYITMGFAGGSVVKNPPNNQEILVQALGQEDPLEKEKATRPSILTWEILWTEKPGRL